MNSEPSALAAAADDALQLLGVPTRSLSLLGKTLQAEHARRISVALKAASAISGRSPEELNDWVVVHPPSLPLVTRVLLAAGSSGHDTVLVMLGQLLGTAWRNGTSDPEQALIVDAIDGLTQQHLLLIAICQEHGAMQEEKFAEATAGVMSEELAVTVAYSLVPRGILNDPTANFYGTPIWRLSRLGRAVAEAGLAVASLD